jgi:hypothetical protein
MKLVKRCFITTTDGVLQLLAYANEVSLLGDDMDTMKKIETLNEASK